VTAKADTKDVVAGLEAGANEYLTKPVDQTALVARVKSVLRIKELHDQVRAQAADLAKWNRTLEQRVTEQLAEIDRMGRLKRFLAPQIAELILSSGDDRMLDSHRRDISVVFCDLRGFTAFAETAEPEEVMSVLREYHRCLGELIHRFEGTLERFTGDGLMVLFNDPLRVPDPSLRAVSMAIDMQAHVADLMTKWRKYGHELGFGMGVAHGYATLGRIGFEGRFDYAAIGSVVNLAARLCAEAKSGQILIDSKVRIAIEASAELEEIGELMLKGFNRPVRAYNVLALRRE
jgi:class 3 adenylate cyclase